MKYLMLTLLAISTLLITGYVFLIPNPSGMTYVQQSEWMIHPAEAADVKVGFNEPTGIAVDQGRLYVSDARNHRIVVLDSQGRVQRLIGEHLLKRPMNLSLRQSRLYVADYFLDQVLVFSTDGRLLSRIAAAGGQPGQLASPGGVDADEQGQVYVADTYNHRVQVFDAQGELLRYWGGKGWGKGQFNYPTDVLVLADGRIAVADGYNDRVQLFTDQGEYLHAWGGPLAMNIHGHFPGWFATVTAIDQQADGSLLVADFYNDRVQRFSLEGELLSIIELPSAVPAHTAIAAASDAQGRIFVVDHARGQVHVWEAVQ